MVVVNATYCVKHFCFTNNMNAEKINVVLRHYRKKKSFLKMASSSVSIIEKVTRLYN